MSRRPLVAVVADHRVQDGQSQQVVMERYLAAIAEAAGAIPVVLPAADYWDPEQLLGRVDGICLTGSPSNVHPARYGCADLEAAPHDERRDDRTLPLVRAAIEHDLPLLAICRGFQELNVALGGTLHTHVHALPGRLDHRAPVDPSVDRRYAARHPVTVAPDGLLAELLGPGSIDVNSLHWQGIDRLAPGLVVEACAPDGLIEAVRVAAARRFALGVQWHPEYRVRENPAALALYRAFGAALGG